MIRLVSLIILLLCALAVPLFPEVTTEQTQTAAQTQTTANTQTSPTTVPYDDKLTMAQRWVERLKSNEAEAPDMYVAFIFMDLGEAGATLKNLNITFDELEALRRHNHLMLAQKSYQELLAGSSKYLYPDDSFHSMRCHLARANAHLEDIDASPEQLAQDRRLAHAKKAQQLWCEYQKYHWKSTLELYREEVKKSTGDFGPDQECESFSDFKYSQYARWIVQEEKLMCPFTQVKDPLLGKAEQPKIPAIYQAALKGQHAPCPRPEPVAAAPLSKPHKAGSIDWMGGWNERRIFTSILPWPDFGGPREPPSRIPDCPTKP